MKSHLVQNEKKNVLSLKKITAFSLANAGNLVNFLLLRPICSSVWKMLCSWIKKKKEKKKCTEVILKSRVTLKGYIAIFQKKIWFK